MFYSKNALSIVLPSVERQNPADRMLRTGARLDKHPLFEIISYSSPKET
jgi:hypothetical protein